MTHIIKAVEDYLSLRIQMGFKLKNTRSVLVNFASYLKTKKASFITTDLALTFAMQNPKASRNQWGARLRSIRQFAMYLKAIDPRTQIPPTDLLPCKHHKKKPYIYSEAEIVKLLSFCKKIPCKHELKPHTYFTLIGLVAVTGMRLNEVNNLKNDCVDLKNGMIEIRETKFQKSRYLPLHVSVIAVLQKYKKHRDKCFPISQSDSFFVNDQGNRLSNGTVRKVFNWISKQIGLRNPTDRIGPRLIDLRHCFAINTLTRWYQKGLNIDSHMLLLSTYLGHEHPSRTYWYLTSTAELRKLVTNKLEKYLGGKI